MSHQNPSFPNHLTPATPRNPSPLQDLIHFQILTIPLAQPTSKTPPTPNPFHL